METPEGQFFQIEHALRLALGNTTGHTQNQVKKALVILPSLKRKLTVKESDE